MGHSARHLAQMGKNAWRKLSFFYPKGPSKGGIKHGKWKVESRGLRQVKMDQE